MQIALFCEICEHCHDYDMCVILDAIRYPELKQQLVNGEFAPFVCKTCQSHLPLESWLSFVYWEKDWLGVVVPSCSNMSIEWLQNHVAYLVFSSSPDRDNLPKVVFVYRFLGDLVDAIATSPHVKIAPNAFAFDFCLRGCKGR